MNQLKNQFQNLTAHFEKGKQKSLDEFRESVPEFRTKVEGEFIAVESSKIDTAYRLVKHECINGIRIFEIDVKDFKCEDCGEVV